MRLLTQKNGSFPPQAETCYSRRTLEYIVHPCGETLRCKVSDRSPEKHEKKDICICFGTPDPPAAAALAVCVRPHGAASLHSTKT